MKIATFNINNVNRRLPNLLAWYGFRSEGPFLLRASEHGALADHDNALYDRVGAELERATGVGVRRASERMRGRNPGSDLDWASVHLGALAFALPIWRVGKMPTHPVERPAADEVDWMMWADAHLPPGAFKPWTSFAHPTLGPVEIVQPGEADAYFATRSRVSQIGAHASKQSQPLSAKSVLMERVETLKSSLGEDEPVTRPAHWSGFRIVPLEIEFWQDGAFRLHDRVRFVRQTRDAVWSRLRLYP